MIRLAVSDIDGTLLKKGEEMISPLILEGIDKLIDNNIIFAAASGRHIGEIKNLFGDRDIIYIYCDGGAVEYKGRIIYKKPINKEETNKNTSYTAFLGTKAVCSRSSDAEFISGLKKRYGVYYNEDIGDLIKLSYFGAQYREYPPNTRQVYKDKDWCDRVATGCDKGCAIEYLQNYLGISQRETAVFGDGENDLGMMRRGKYKFIMETAPPMLKLSGGKVIKDITAEFKKIAEEGIRYE